MNALGLVAFVFDVRARIGYWRDSETRKRNARFRAHAHDDLPLPPPALVYAINGHFDLETYYESGRRHAEIIRQLLAGHALPIERFHSLLDFGCGCGRVLRQWRELAQTHVHGCDYNPKLVDWCRHSLLFAEFRLNQLEPPLPYPDAEMEFVYGLSVFTHLTEELQKAWLRDLERVLTPGGVLLLTTKGRSWFSSLNAEERARFERGELVVQEERYPGKNFCAAFHPEAYVRERFTEAFRVLDIVAATDNLSQDIVLLQKPA